MKIVVTGGAGFIASHIADAYVDRGHNVSIIDDLSTGQKRNLNSQAKIYAVDIADPKAVKLIATIKPDVLNHHAAQMDVRRSVADPTFDARINIIGFINLLEACKDAGVKKIIFSSSGGAVYGDREPIPATEEHETLPLSPYGVSKLTGELYLGYYHMAFGLPFVALRYANVYGPRQSTLGEAGVVAIFIAQLLAGKSPVINGDGKQTRDYVFVGDVVRANVAVTRRPLGANRREFAGSIAQVRRDIDSFRDIGVDELILDLHASASTAADLLDLASTLTGSSELSAAA